MDVQEAVDPPNWPEVDSQPLSTDESWRLRVASAQVYSIVKNRDMEHFERVMGFLDATYRLLPKLVAPIKHMKLLFGLKTMVIMWMLREGRGMVDTVFKITQFFPSKLPQYQDHCNQHEMFLMRKNNLDFKALAQDLAMDKDKREDYVKKQMEKQYGEHYAQKVEDRLLQYLHELETVLPVDTFIDKILKKDSPVTEEKKLLLEVITSDSMTIATTQRKLLHCGVASCCPATVCLSPEQEENEVKSSQLSQSVPNGSFPTVSQEVSQDSPLLWENPTSHVRRHQQTNEAGETIKKVGEESSNKEKQETSQRCRECVQEAFSPQFCSRHQRWVKSILQDCPDECSEELLLQANVSLSPPLFQSSSSSTSSSEDLTPSDLIPCPSDQQDPPSQTATPPQTAAQISEQANCKGKQSSVSASSTSEMESLPQPPSRGTLLPPLLFPVVRLVDIASCRSSYPIFKPHQVSSNHFIMSSNKQAPSASSPQLLTNPHCHISRNKNSTLDQLESVARTDPQNTMYKLQTGPIAHDAAAFTSCQTQPLQSSSRLSRKHRHTFTANRHSRSLDGFGPNPLPEQSEKAPTTFQMSYLPLPDLSVSWPSTHNASTSASQSGTFSSVCTAKQIRASAKTSEQVVPQNSIKYHPQTHNTGPSRSNTLLCSTVLSSNSNSDCLAVRSETCRVRRAKLRLSLPSQAVLLHSTRIQPYVSLTRLSVEECYRVTKGRSSARYVEPVLKSSSGEERKKNLEENSYSIFDPNTLYSSDSSSNDSEGLLDLDPDYKPRIKKKRLLLKYETARSQNNI